MAHGSPTPIANNVNPARRPRRRHGMPPRRAAAAAAGGGQKRTLPTSDAVPPAARRQKAAAAAAAAAPPRPAGAPGAAAAAAATEQTTTTTVFQFDQRWAQPVKEIFHSKELHDVVLSAGGARVAAHRTGHPGRGLAALARAVRRGDAREQSLGGRAAGCGRAGAGNDRGIRLHGQDRAGRVDGGGHHPGGQPAAGDGGGVCGG